MTNGSLAPPYYGVDRAQRSQPGTGDPRHDLLQKGLTGRLTFSYETVGNKYVTPGTGTLRAVEADDGSEVLAYAAARRGGVPVLPGTGIKGAVRTLYEILTGSCNITTSPCNGGDYCAACRLFGKVRGGPLQGRLGFDDAMPAGDGAVTTSLARVPEGHEPHAHHTPGDVRLYDLRIARDRQRGTGEIVERKELLSREVYRGRFIGGAVFRNVLPAELGTVLLAMGMAPAPEGDAQNRGFPLRLGGVRFHGQGAVRVAVEGLLLVRSPVQREELNTEAMEPETGTWIDQALTLLHPSAKRALAEISEVLNREDG